MAIRKIVSRSIGTDVIAAEDLAANSVTVAEIQDDAVTSAKIDSTSTGMALADLSVDSGVLTVDATNNRVGINTATPSTQFEVYGTGSVMRLTASDNTNASVLQLGDTDDLDVCQIRYEHSSDNLNIFTGGTQRLRIDSDGLKFGSDSAAANALDDYEEGTWSPTLYTQNPARYNFNSYSVSDARYVKVGSLVELTARITFDGTYYSSYDNIAISNLPFASKNNTGYYPYGKLYVNDSAMHADAAVRAGLGCYISTGSTYMSLYTTGTTNSAVYHGNFSYWLETTSSGEFRISISYQTDS
jgi:hypothetical protein